MALALGVGAAFAGSERAGKGLAATAAAATGFRKVMDDSYAQDLESALLGVEIARTRIFKSILKGQQKNLLKYPLSRAVNDAMRYHSVCNLAEGKAESSRALSGELRVVQGRTNRTPKISRHIPDMTVILDEEFNYSFSEDTFTDSDGDPLEYKVSLIDGSSLSGWLRFESDSRKFAGTPKKDSEGPLDVRFIAEDFYGGSVYQVFRIYLKNQESE